MRIHSSSRARVFWRWLSGFLLFEPRGVIALIRNSKTAVEFEDPARDVIEEVTVMRDGDDGAFVFAQVMFEPRHRFGVEVVGGFVEQENVGFGEQGSGVR